MKNKGKKLSLTLTMYVSLVLLLSNLLYFGVMKPLSGSILKVIENIFY